MGRKRAAGGPAGDEAAFLAAIATAPDDDTPRLAFADWLDEHGRADEAEFIRVQCELEPIRERHGEARTDRLLAREREFLVRSPDPEAAWLSGLTGRYGMRVDHRRGFPDALHLPARWLVEHGAALRARYPLLRRLVVYRLNGWGRELAACPHLAGVRELDLPCWYDGDDAAALAASPHLGDLEVLHYWRGDEDQDGQLRTLAGSAAWPRLRTLRVVLGEPADVGLVDAAAGRAVADVYNPYEANLFPFAADFSSSFLVGRLADGRQFFALDACATFDLPDPPPGPVEVPAQLFDPAGNPTTTLAVAFPTELVFPAPGTPGARLGDPGRDGEWRRRRERFLRDTIGFEPALIRVRSFDLRDFGPYPDDLPEHTGRRDDPRADPAADPAGPLGYGGGVYGPVSNAEYCFSAGNLWICDKTGHVVFT